ncbi:MAG TPA: hypothetical protein PK548_07185 [Bacteroidales bacterium]|nr:hypothetical protein [Bacteroidales bacterium]
MRDIILDDNGNVQISNNNLFVSDCNFQTAQHLIVAYPGEFKLYPLLGGKIRDMQNGTVDPFWPGNVKSQLKKCNIEADINITATDIEIQIKD